MRGVRLGLFGARGDNRGLAVQTAEFARHLGPSRIFGIDMDELSPYPCDWSEFDGARLTIMRHDKITPEHVERWLHGLDAVWGAETFYRPWVTGLCHRMGVRTVLAVNPEFAAHVYAPDWAPLPDVVAPPTDWRVDHLPAARPLPHGVCRHRLPYRPRTECRTFLHVAGHPAAHDRAGTQTVIDALPHVRRPCRVVIRSQQPSRITEEYGAPARRHDVRLDMQVGNIDRYWHLYDDGDVLLAPRRYGGQTLPVIEALSTGMPVLASDTEPQNRWLPEEMLVRTHHGRVFHSRVGPLALADTDPVALAAAMDRMTADPALVERLSKEADRIADRWAWPNLVPCYERLVQSLVHR